MEVQTTNNVSLQYKKGQEFVRKISFLREKKETSFFERRKVLFGNKKMQKYFNIFFILTMK